MVTVSAGALRDHRRLLPGVLPEPRVMRELREADAQRLRVGRSCLEE